MNDRLLVDGACFERGCVCMSSSYHVHEIPEHAVWMHKEKEWVGLSEEEINSVYAEIQEKVYKHWDDGGTTMMFPTTLYQAFEAKLKERNT